MNDNTELYHYGVKGMKWGVRKDKKRLGEVTVSRTNNKVGPYYSDKDKKKMTDRARKSLTQEERLNRARSEVYSNKANRHKNKADSYTNKSQHDKAKKQLEKRKEAMTLAKEFTKQANTVNKRLSDIDSGRLKAGRDFVTNRKVTTNLALDAIGFVNVQITDTVEFKK